MGPVLTQILKHLPEEKIYHRGFTGSINPETKAGTGGRSGSGTASLGNMEVAALSAAHVAELFKLQTCSQSDEYDIIICNGCKNEAFIDASKDHYTLECERCNISQSPEDNIDINSVPLFTKVVLSYHHKMMTDFFLSLGVKMTFGSSDSLRSHEEYLIRKAALRKDICENCSEPLYEEEGILTCSRCFFEY